MTREEKAQMASNVHAVLFVTLFVAFALSFAFEVRVARRWRFCGGVGGVGGRFANNNNNNNKKHKKHQRPRRSSSSPKILIRIKQAATPRRRHRRALRRLARSSWRCGPCGTRRANKRALVQVLLKVGRARVAREGRGQQVPTPAGPADVRVARVASGAVAHKAGGLRVHTLH